MYEKPTGDNWKNPTAVWVSPGPLALEGTVAALPPEFLLTQAINALAERITALEQKVTELTEGEK